MSSITRQIKRTVTRNEARGLISQHILTCPRCRAPLKKRWPMSKKVDCTYCNWSGRLK